MKKFFVITMVWFGASAFGLGADLGPVIEDLSKDFRNVMLRPQKPPAPFVRRPVFAKAHGCLKAKFTINPKLAPENRVGAFAGESYTTWIRFSNDGGYGSDENPVARGMAVKLVGVKTKDGKAVTQDFIMQNHPVFFSDNASDFRDFIRASLSGREAAEKYQKEHPTTKNILDAMDLNLLADPLDGTYWTPTPYKLGDRAMKYRTRPCGEPPKPSTKPMTGNHFLRENLIEHLKQSSLKNEDVCFLFEVQIQKNEATMPIDKATVLWDEKESEFLPFATITISPKQDVNAPDREMACEKMAFAGAHCVPEHEPLGSINEARKVIYQRMADQRREPTEQESSKK